MERTNVKDALKTATQRLAEAGCDTPGLDAEVLLAHALGKDRAWLYTYPLDILSQKQATRFDDLLRRRERREPVAYITGHKEFFALDFWVNRHALIPRPETELLVETALQIASQPARRVSIGQSANQRVGESANEKPIGNTQYATRNAHHTSRITHHVSHPPSPLSIADVGTGSGCIAIALAKNLPQAFLIAIDTSLKALQLARQNAARHQVVDRISFLVGDLLQPLTAPVDLIVSNPPYLSRLELSAASPEIRRHEPHLALDGGPDGLGVIRRLLAQAKGMLKPGGSLLMEIGAGQAEIVTYLAKKHFPGAKIQIEKDLAGLDRLLIVESVNI